VHDSKVHDINSIYSLVIGLLASGREIGLKDLFSHELAPVPVAMFNENGMKICKNQISSKEKSPSGNVEQNLAP